MTAILDLPLYEAEIETRSNADARGSFAVSYTHLTLPTILLV